jgi:hypothetical protein
MPALCFQCPQCGLGDYETGYPTDGAEVYCIVCEEEAGRLVRLHYWEEAEQSQARLRLADAA